MHPDATEAPREFARATSEKAVRQAEPVLFHADLRKNERTLAFAGQGSGNDWLVVLTARFLNLRTPGQDHLSTKNTTDCDSESTEGVQTLTQPITRLDQSEILQLVSDYVSGSSVRQLARDWNVHRTTVVDHLERHNIPRRPHVRKMTDAQVREAAELYQAGTSLARLGARYHVDPQTVSKELKRAGVTIRPPGRGAHRKAAMSRQSGQE